MEKFVHVAESSKKLLNSQGVVLQNYQAFFKENLLLINGKVRIRVSRIDPPNLAWLWKDISRSLYSVDEDLLHEEEPNPLSCAISTGNGVPFENIVFPSDSRSVRTFVLFKGLIGTHS
jgi:hypothetical protein